MPFFRPDHAIGTAVLSGAIGMVGVFLDTSWHRTIGRDSFFIAPHAFVYVGVLGLMSAAIGPLAEATHGRVADFGGPILRLGPLRLPLGFTIVALGVLTVIVAAPVDEWWHRQFGKDVLLWSPPHLQLHFGAWLIAVGLVLAIAAQSGRGVFRHRVVWRAAMLVVLTDLVHRALFVQAHYTMVPESRTPDFYPFLVAMFVPVALVAATRILGPWAPIIVSALFFAITVLAYAVLTAIDFVPYTVTPLVVIPAAVVTALAFVMPRFRDRVAWAALAGVAFVVVFTAMETAWMAAVVGRPWPLARVVAGLPRSFVAGALSGYVGWVLGTLALAVMRPDGMRDAFGSVRRARIATTTAVVIVAAGLVASYAPQRFGSPMTPDELRLQPVTTFTYQDAVFWDALLLDDWDGPQPLHARSEGIIDGLPLPVGPGWCAPDQQTLETALPSLSFALEVNGAPVDLRPYPIVRLRDRYGAHCAWVGVSSQFQRASENRFRYTVKVNRDGQLPRQTVIDMAVVFKDP